MLETKVVEKIKTHILCSITFSSENRAGSEISEKYGGTRQVTDDNIIRRMRFGCWMVKASKTHSERVILIALPQQQ